MKKVLFIIIAALLLFSCNAKKSLIGKRPEKGTYYFPLDTLKYDPTHEFGREDKLNPFVNKWYSEHLYTLKEPILHNLSTDSLEVYRFTRLELYTYCITVIKENQSITLSFKATTGDGNNTGYLIKNRRLRLTQKEFESLKQKMTDIRFENLPTHGNRGLDGGEYIIETYHNRKYHLVRRWSPEDYPKGNEDFISLYQIFERLSGEFPEENPNGN